MKVCYIDFYKHMARVDRRVARSVIYMPKTKGAKSPAKAKKLVDTVLDAHLRRQRLKREAARKWRPL